MINTFKIQEHIKYSTFYHNDRNCCVGIAVVLRDRGLNGRGGEGMEVGCHFNFQLFVLKMFYRNRAAHRKSFSVYFLKTIITIIFVSCVL